MWLLIIDCLSRASQRWLRPYRKQRLVLKSALTEMDHRLVSFIEHCAADNFSNDEYVITDRNMLLHPTKQIRDSSAKHWSKFMVHFILQSLKSRFSRQIRFSKVFEYMHVAFAKNIYDKRSSF